jgi:hypothetical protein
MDKYLFVDYRDTIKLYNDDYKDSDRGLKGKQLIDFQKEIEFLETKFTLIEVNYNYGYCIIQNASRSIPHIKFKPLIIECMEPILPCDTCEKSCEILGICTYRKS